MKNTFRIYLSILLWLCFSNSVRAMEQPVDTTQVYSARYCVNTLKIRQCHLCSLLKGVTH